MPIALTPGDRRLLVGGISVFVLIVGLTIALISGGDSSETPTTYSAGSTGAKALYVLLPRLGYRVERWIQPPDEMTDAATTTWILAEPSGPPTPSEQAAVTSFLAAGGRVIATGFTGSFFLGHGSMPRLVLGLNWLRADAAVPSRLARAAPAITIADGSAWPARAPGRTLYRVNDTAVVVEVPSPGGEAFWWAAATPLTNAGLREPGNLEFVLASLGPPGQRRVVFDEYFHGRRASLAASVFRTPVKWIAAQAALVAVIVLLTYSRRSGPVMMPAAESRLSPLEFVRTVGALYARAGAASVAVDAAYRRLRYWLTRRLGLNADATADHIQTAARDRWGGDQPVAATLKQCEAARDQSALRPRDALAHVQAIAALATSLQVYGSTDKEKR